MQTLPPNTPTIMQALCSPPRWVPYEIIWLGLFSTLAVTQTLVNNDTWFAFSVFLSGVFCVLLAAKGHMANYIFGLYNSLSYAILAHENHLYGEMGLNLFFFAPMSLVGIWLWRRHMADTQVRMLALNAKALAAWTLACLMATWLLGAVLTLIEGQKTPYLDACTNVLSVAATVLMAMRYKEQWLAYISINILSVLMWFLRTGDGTPSSVMMVIMWSAYLLNSLYGYWNWSRGAQRDETQNEEERALQSRKATI